jgi:tetratricopeptide (TPR) repeat protein
MGYHAGWRIRAASAALIALLASWALAGGNDDAQLAARMDRLGRGLRNLELPPERRVEAGLELGEIYLDLEEYARAIEVISEAEALSKGLPTSSPLVMKAREALELQLRNHGPAPAYRAFLRTRLEQVDVSDRLLWVERLVFVDLHSGDLVEAIQTLDRELQGYEKGEDCGDEKICHYFGGVLVVKGNILTQQGRLRDAVRVYREAMAIAETNLARAPEWGLEARQNLAWSLGVLGELDDAIEAHRACVALWTEQQKGDRAEMPYRVAENLDEISRLLAMQGKKREAALAKEEAAGARARVEETMRPCPTPFDGVGFKRVCAVIE